MAGAEGAGEGNVYDGWFNQLTPPPGIVEVHTTTQRCPALLRYLAAVNFEFIAGPGYGCYNDTDMEGLGLDMAAVAEAGLPPLRVYAFAWDFAGGFFGVWHNQLDSEDISRCPVVRVGSSGEFEVIAGGVIEYFAVLCALNESFLGPEGAEETLEVGPNGFSKAYLSHAQTDAEGDELAEGRAELLRLVGDSATTTPFATIVRARGAFESFLQYAKCTTLKM